MDEQLTISTPEQVAFHYETAGIGSRMAACLLDYLVIGVLLFFFNCAAFSIFPNLGNLGLAGDAGDAAIYLVLAILVLVNFLVMVGYFAFFETIWQGQTPGKRSGKLRVMKRSGQPIGAGESMVRNLVRIVDFLPAFYGIGLIVMFVDHDARRLGDMAAGTIVVRLGDQVSLRDVRVPEPASSVYSAASLYAQSPYGSTSQAYGAQNYSQPARVVRRPDPLEGVSLRGVTPDDYRLIREMLERVNRNELDAARGQELAARLAYGVAAHMGHNFDEWRTRGWDPFLFLQSVLDAREARGE